MGFDTGLVVRRGDRVFVPFGDAFQRLHRLRALKDPGESGVVGLRNRVELMVVTASTSDRQPQHCPANGVDLLVDDVHLHLCFVAFGQYLRTK